MDAIGRGLIFLSEENNKEEQEEGERRSVRDKDERGKIFAGEGRIEWKQVVRCSLQDFSNYLMKSAEFVPF